MAGGSHLPRAGDVFVLPGGTLGATLSLRAPTEIEPAAGCVESWPSQPPATASTTKRILSITSYENSSRSSGSAVLVE